MFRKDKLSFSNATKIYSDEMILYKEIGEWPRTPRQPLTCRGGAGRGGTWSGAQGCGGERS